MLLQKKKQKYLKLKVENKMHSIYYNFFRHNFHKLLCIYYRFSLNTTPFKLSKVCQMFGGVGEAEISVPELFVRDTLCAYKSGHNYITYSK